MGERSDQIELEIREKRNELGDNFSELERKVKTAMDWREQFREHPGTLLAVAFGGGALLAALFPPRSSGARYRSRIQTYSSDASAAAAREVSPSYTAPVSPQHNDVKENIDALRGAVVGMALNRLTSLIDGLLPGFQQEFTRAKTYRRSSEPHSDAYSAGETQRYDSPDYARPS